MGDLAWEQSGWNASKILNKADLWVEGIFHIELAEINQQLPLRSQNKFWLIYRLHDMGYFMHHTLYSVRPDW
jgi:hypothetical protein